MSRTPLSRPIGVVAVLAVVACMAVVALGTLAAGGIWMAATRLPAGQAEKGPPDADSTVDHLSPTTPTTASIPARSLKGWELYSWLVQGEWQFSLVVGTNRLKTFEEVSSPDARVQGVEALKMELDRLARGEQIFWLEQRVPGMSRPPVEMVEAIRAHCTERDLRLETDWE